MKKKILSFIAILCTAVCVLIMVFADKIGTKGEIYKDKIEVINDNNTLKENANIKKEASKEASKDENKDKNEINQANSFAVTDAYKSFKMNEISEKMQQDKKVFFEESDKAVEAKKVADKESSKKISSEDAVSESVKKDSANYSSDSTPVFKVSKSKIKDKLTLSDKEKLLSIAAKLSAVDYEKINTYLQNGSDEDIKNTIKLLKSRLSDKDYEKVKLVAEKFINMDVVEQ
jgi:lipopolysaccharide export LptBFGC system permease protein LptF